MGIGYFPYLFDHIGFVNLIFPLVPQLKQGNYQPLFELAKEVMKNNPELWDTLYELNMGYSFAEEAEELDPNSLLTKVMARFLKTIDMEDQNAWRMLKPTLPLIGWTEKEINLLLYGKSLCTLLLPEKANILPLRMKNYEEDKSMDFDWCDGYLGWLDIKSISLLLSHLKRSKREFYSLSQHPDNRIQKEFDYVVNISQKWLTKRLLDSYEYTENIFTLAHEANTSLALAIA